MKQNCKTCPNSFSKIKLLTEINQKMDKLIKLMEYSATSNSKTSMEGT